MRTYAQREALYRQARQMGVVFINYELHGKPLVTEEGSHVNVEVWDHVLHRPLKIKADLVILAAAIRPKTDAADLAKLYKIPVDGDGFFQEAHAKLRPVDLSTDGMFVAGLHDTPDSIEKIVDYAVETDIDTIQICALTPFPGWLKPDLWTHLRVTVRGAAAANENVSAKFLPDGARIIIR